MKKIAILALLLSISLASCGDGNPHSTDNDFGDYGDIDTADTANTADTGDSVDTADETDCRLNSRLLKKYQLYNIIK